MANSSNIERKIDTRKLFKVCLYIFTANSLAALGLGYWGFITPPKGIIDPSVLQFSCIIMGFNSVFDAFVLGFLALVSNKPLSFKTKHGETLVGYPNPSPTSMIEQE